MGRITDEVKQLARWQMNPLEWVEFMWPDVELTSQQRQFFEELGKLVRAKLKKADMVELTKEEEEYAKKIGISVMSGKGTGKDATAAITTLWFMSVFPYPKNSATANTFKQLQNVYWAEVSKWMRTARKREGAGKSLLQEMFEKTRDKLYLKDFKGSEWFTELVTIDTSKSEEEQAEAIAGRHEDYQLWIIDEASGIADKVFKNIEDTLTRKLNIMVILFNPTRSKGYAIDSQSDPRFISMRWNAEESELVSPDHIQGIAEKYGKDSNAYRVSVLGLPPLTEDDVLIPWDWIEDAIARDVEPLESDKVVMGVDVGGGGDETVIAIRKGYKVYPFKRINSPDPVVVTNWIGAQIDSVMPDVVRVDIVGMGWAVEGNLRAKKGVLIEPADSRGSSSSDRFQNKRAEMFWRLREAMKYLDLPDDEQLKMELGSIKIKINERNGKIMIEHKKELRARLGGKSTNYADALALTFYYPDEYTCKYTPSVSRKVDFRRRPENAWLMA